VRFAIVDGQRGEAQPKQRGICQACGDEVIAKCGRVKVWHWAHKGRLSCDPWWENETEWHRKWKAQFPPDWQEQVATDPITGERHIADVRIPYGLVIEFQHSTIAPAEIAAREKFYGNMIWIVDGDRGTLDPAYFKMGLSGPIQKDPPAYQIEWLGRSHFLHNWSQVHANVFLDFGDEHLWLLVSYDHSRKLGAVGLVSKKTLVELCLNGEKLPSVIRDG
jgi:hypothetical protein